MLQTPSFDFSSIGEAGQKPWHWLCCSSSDISTWLEEIAYVNKFITREQLLMRARLFEKTAYGQALFDLVRYR